MTAAESTSALVVSVAVRMLPSGLRDRYREQWSADLRDAGEAGIRPSEIALGALTFAATAGHAPVETGARRIAPNVDRRARLAAALALGATVLSVSQYASAATGSVLGGDLATTTFEFVVRFVAPMLLVAFAVIAPIVAVLLVSVTRGMYRSVRIAVWSLALAGAAGYALPLQVVLTSPEPNVYVSLSVIAHVLAVILTVGAVILLARQFSWARWSTKRDPQTPSASAALTTVLISTTVAVGAAVTLGLISALDLLTQLNVSGAAFVTRLQGAVSPVDVDLAAALARANLMSVTAIVVWAASGVLLAVLVGALTWFRVAHTRDVVLATLAALFLLAISHAWLVTYAQLLALGGPGTWLAIPSEVLLLVGRAGLVALLLATVGRIRLTRSRPAAAVTATA